MSATDAKIEEGKMPLLQDCTNSPPMKTSTRFDRFDDIEEEEDYTGGSRRRSIAIGFVVLLCSFALFSGLRGHFCKYMNKSAPSSSDKAAVAVPHPPRSLFGAAAIEAATAAPLRDFQVYPPVLTPNFQGNTALTNGSENAFQTSLNVKAQGCVVEQTLMVHEFANSYGAPFVGAYHPPSCAFNRVTWNLTVTSAGRQFDRLGIVYFGSTELWRTSTAEPTANGIIWTYIKDMSNYLALFKEPQTLIFDLGNTVDSTYTGPYFATLTATFFTSEDTVDPADMIVPVSAGLGPKDMASVYTVPPQTAENNLTLPRNINKAVFTVSATGQIDEEFWYGDVFNPDLLTFGPGALYPYSPFREVQLLIDGMLAGVAWPFPIVFTGGIVPGLWRPIVGIDAFDLRENEIDITPWLPLLCDGKSHSFQIIVSGVNNTGNVATLSEVTGGYWLVTGKVFMWLDPSGSITTGSSITRNTPLPQFQISSAITKDASGNNQTLANNITAQRQLSISSTVRTASGTKHAFWTQDLSYYNYDFVSNYGDTQAFTQNTQGTDLSSSGYGTRYSYPLAYNSTGIEYANGNLTITAVVDRYQNIQIVGEPVFPSGLQSFSPIPAVQASYPKFQGSNLQTRQNGTAAFFENSTASSGFGSTQQEFSFSGIQIASPSSRGSTQGGGSYYPTVQGSSELYHRFVSAVNATVVENSETLIGRPFVTYAHPAPPRGPETANQLFARPPNARSGSGHGH